MSPSSDLRIHWRNEILLKFTQWKSFLCLLKAIISLKAVSILSTYKRNYNFNFILFYKKSLPQSAL